MMRYITLFFLLVISPLIAMESFTLDTDTPASGYEVSFQGVDDPQALDLLKRTSQLVLLQNSPPDTRFGLRRRADDDLEHFVDALHSLAYYNARVDIIIDSDATPPDVIVSVHLGPKYTLAAYIVTPINEDCAALPYDEINAEMLGMSINCPATPELIIASEEEMVNYLAVWGYPFGKIVKRDVIADQATKTITVKLLIDPGSFGYFGPTEINGAKKTKMRFFQKRIRWHEGSRYEPCWVEKTRDALEDSGIFSSVNISLGEADDAGLIPMQIDVVEAKQRSLGFGVSYTTLLGPGVAAEWEHRNLRGMGERLSLNVSIWERLKEATLSYAIPYFGSRRQELIWLLDVEEDITKGYTARAASFSGNILRKLNKYSQLSYGAMIKVLKDTRSNNNRDFTLFKTPVEYRWSNADSLLDPHHGVSFDLRTVPSLQIFSPMFYYQTNTAIFSAYYPWSKNITLAGKAVVGSIFGSPEITIPPSERFYAGTDSLLRGYQYKTVSPLDAEDDPIGGRSMMVYSFEYRQKLSENWGWVGFYDVGNVYSDVLPPINQKLLNSLGFGIRYYTPVGPLRADFAFPLNPRKNIDKPFQFYISIGQSF
jgi:translocation and assembly module TamA